MSDILLSALKGLGRLYPLKSGCGRIANSGLAKTLAPAERRDVWADVAGMALNLPMDDLVGRAAVIFGDLDPKISATITRLTRPGDTALDIGGNLGVTSAFFARAVGPGGRVHVFEPNPDLVARLEAAKARAGASPITLHPIGLGDEEGRLTLSAPSENAGKGTLTDAGFEGGVSHQVEVRRLDAYMAEIGETAADVVKIDVEGFEREVLLGGDGFFKSARPRAFIIEEHGWRGRRPSPGRFHVVGGGGLQNLRHPKNPPIRHFEAAGGCIAQRGE